MSFSQLPNLPGKITSKRTINFIEKHPQFTSLSYPKISNFHSLRKFKAQYEQDIKKIYEAKAQYEQFCTTYKQEMHMVKSQHLPLKAPSTLTLKPVLTRSYTNKLPMSRNVTVRQDYSHCLPKCYSQSRSGQMRQVAVGLQQAGQTRQQTVGRNFNTRIFTNSPVKEVSGIRNHILQLSKRRQVDL